MKKFLLSLLLLGQLYAENVVIFFVEAPHLNYSTPKKFLKTMAKHPSNGSRNRDVGHAWFYLEGEYKERKIVLEGGHSGELGIDQPTYSQGLLENIALGAKDPISYLFCGLEDGFFQHGNGGHRATFAAKKTLADDEFLLVMKCLCTYPFRTYSLTGRQCCSLLQEIAASLGLRFNISRQILLPSKVKIGKSWLTLWNNEKYSTLTFACPDLLEKELMAAVARKKLERVIFTNQKRISLRNSSDGEALLEK